MALYYYLSDFTHVHHAMGKTTTAACPCCNSSDNVSIQQAKGFFKCFTPNCSFRGIYAGEERPKDDGTEAGQISRAELQRLCQEHGWRLPSSDTSGPAEPQMQQPMVLESSEMSLDPWDEIEPSELIVSHYPKDASHVPRRHQHYKGFRADHPKFHQLHRLDFVPQNYEEELLRNKALDYLQEQRISLPTALLLDLRCCYSHFDAKETGRDDGSGHSKEPTLAYPDWLGSRCTSVKLRALTCKTFRCIKASDNQPCVPYGVTRFAPWLVDDTYLRTVELWGGWDQPMPDRADPHRCVIFTEGEHDALALAEAGFLNVISVSTGAGEDVRETLRPFMQWIATQPEVIICGDVDEQGELMKQRLLYLFSSRSRLVRIPMPHRDEAGREVICKDVGDVLRLLGPERVRQVVLGAVTVHSPRVVTFDAMRDEIKHHAQGIYDEGIRTGYGPETDRHIQFKQEGGICCVTGYPNSGKSDFLYDLAAHLMLHQHKRFLFVSMEQPDHADAMAQLIHIVTRQADLSGFDAEELDPVIDQLNDLCQFYNFDNGDPSVSEIIQTVDLNVQFFKPDFVVVDNYARLKRPNLNDQRETDFIHDLLCELQGWGKRNHIWSFVVAHPRKPQDSGEDHMADGTTVSGSAHWYNLSDMAITIKRVNSETNSRVDPRVDYKQIHIWKIRDQRLCSLGDLYYLRQASGRYEERATSQQCESECICGPQWVDTGSWV